ncbi:MAG TPA: hypothetical protein VIR63_02680 [Pontiella sp.]
MKYTATVIISLLAVASFAQMTEENPDTPALLEAVNGKTARVYLQNLENGSLSFKPSKSAPAMDVPVGKVKSLRFSMSKEEFDFFRSAALISDDKISEIYNMPEVGKAEKLELIFAAFLENVEALFAMADYEGVVKALAPVMQDRGQYMMIENNLEDVFLFLMESYQTLGNVPKAKECAEALKGSDNAEKALKSKVTLALVAIAEGNLEEAENIVSGIDHAAAQNYLTSVLLRTKGELVQAIKNTADMIRDHSNDIEWLPRVELLGAHIYLDLAGLENSVYTTNSAMRTAQQVKNIYAGSNVAEDARKLWVSLGGEENEAREISESERLIEEERKEYEREQEAKKQKAAKRKASKEEQKKAPAAEVKTEPAE